MRWVHKTWVECTWYAFSHKAHISSISTYTLLIYPCRLAPRVYRYLAFAKLCLVSHAACRSSGTHNYILQKLTHNFHQHDTHGPHSPGTHTQPMRAIPSNIKYIILSLGDRNTRTRRKCTCVSFPIFHSILLLRFCQFDPDPENPRSITKRIFPCVCARRSLCGCQKFAR